MIEQIGYISDAGFKIFLIPGSFFFLCIAGYYNLKGNSFYSSILIFMAAICMFLFAALLDPFLNVWDERFHALVAKNFMDHFFVPTLYDDPVLMMEYAPWDRFHIWLQKQPLFMWQMAVSMNLFGVNEFICRLPSVFNASLIAVAAYRSGIILINKNIGFIAASLVISSNYLIELVSGRQELDHNDVFFITYVSLSIWSFFEYKNSGKLRWVMMIGIFSGMAIMCKWLVGLLVYFHWFVFNLIQGKYEVKYYKDIFTALLITCVIVIPWQLYTFIYYFEEAKHVYLENASHFFTVLHGHDGNYWYHFNKINLIYGKTALLLIIPAIVVFIRQVKNKKNAYSILVAVLFVYTFFTLAATKMPSFTAVCFLYIILMLSGLIIWITQRVICIFKNKYITSSMLLVLFTGLFFYRVDFAEIYQAHFAPNNNHVRIMKENTELFKSLKFTNDFVLFNVPGRHYIEAMFYTGLPCYNTIPSLEQYHDLKLKGRKIAILNSQHIVLPEYLLNDRSVVLYNSIVRLSE